MTTLLLAEHGDGALKDTTRRALTCALALGAPVHLLIVGHDLGPAVDAASRLDGVARVLVLDRAAFAHPLAEPLAAVCVALSPGYTAIVAPATKAGKNVLPRIAALLDVMQVSEVMRVLGPDTFERPIYAGNLVQTVTSTDRIRLLTVRTSAFAPAGEGGDGAIIEAIEAGSDPSLSRFESGATTRNDRPELTSAKSVVSGGRALGSPQTFNELIVPLADVLGAATGASRAAVDAGYAPNDWQVGQTGKIVAPDLYVAIGISGAIQHLAGMKDAKVIVAINKDDEAPIFQISDYGLVADLFAAVPELTRALQGLRP